MDPLLVAAQRFHSQLRMAWEPLPGSEQQAPALLRLIAEQAYRGQMVKALRLAEWAPDNRRPYVIVEDEPTPAVIHRQIVEDFTTLCRALRDDGLNVPELKLGDAGSSHHDSANAGAEPESEISKLLATMAQATTQLGGLDVLDGIVLAIVPRHAQLPSCDLLLQLMEHAGYQRGAVRLLLWDPREELAKRWPAAAHFAVDGLWRHLTELVKATPEGGPKARELASSPSQRQAMEQRLGKRASARQAASMLNGLLLDAGRLQQDGRPKAAERKLRNARMLCRMEGLATQQAVCSLALGASLCGRDSRGALAAFRDARALAESQNQPSVEVQALLGTAAVHLQEQRFTEAEHTYAIAARVAEDAALESLRLAALRMQGACR